VLRLRTGAAVVIRNAGGRAADALRSLIVAHHVLGLQQVFVIHHTDCRLLHLSEAAVWQKVRFATGVNVDDPFLTFNNLEQSVREDLELIGMEPSLQGRLAIRGFIYDVRAGCLNEVQPRNGTSI
jgi:carbonic anhydrase